MATTNLSVLLLILLLVGLVVALLFLVLGVSSPIAPSTFSLF